MKKASYSEKVFNYLNENKFDLTSLLTEEASSLEDLPDSEDSGSDIEEPKESTEDKNENSGKDDAKEVEELAAVVDAKKKYDLEKKVKEYITKKVPPQQPAADIMKGVLTNNNLKSDSYYRQVKGLQKFIFEDNSEEQVLDFENKISVPVLVNNTLDYIDKFDSMFDKPQYCYDVAVEQIIKYGGTDFEKLLKDFDMQFHETYRKRFPSADESPVMSYVNNQNYKNAADAQKSG